MSNTEFLDLLALRDRGRLKIYVGSAAGVGKTFRMLQEGDNLRRRGVDVVIGFVETHGRPDTEAQIGELETVPRQQVSYRDVVLEEMNLDALLARRPQVAIVDELAHTNVPGVRNGKRWQDVVALLDAGISVIAAMNVQHLESLNDVIAATLGVTVRETVPDWLIGTADQVVNIDISAEDLRERLREGKIYKPEKVESALRNFFTEENLTTLRELALREVASSVDRTREAIVRREPGTMTRAPMQTVDRVLVAMSSNPPYTAALLRKASRIAGRLNSDWYCVYVQTADEAADRIESTVQRTLVANIQLAQSMGAEVVKLSGDNIAETIRKFASEHAVSLVIVGRSRRSRYRRLFRGTVIDALLETPQAFDVLIASFGESARSARSPGTPTELNAS